MQIDLSGRVEAGKMIWDNPAFALNSFKQFEGKRVSLALTAAKRKRSYLQNAYYWGIVIEILYAAFRSTGEQFGRADLHEMLKAKFLPGEYIGPGGEMIGTFAKSTASLSTAEFMAYIADIQQWASETFGIVIPDPNESR